MEEKLLITTALNIFDDAPNFLKAYTESVAERCSEFTIESWADIFLIIKTVTYVSKEMISEEIETALTNSEDRSASSAEQLQSTEDCLSLGSLFLNK